MPLSWSEESEESEAGQGQQGSDQRSWQEGSFWEHYLFLGHIAEGGFGEVKLALHQLTGTEVAVKVLGKGGQASLFIMAEVDIMKTLRHPNVIQLFQVLETPKHVYVVMEHASGGDLLQCLRSGGGMPEEEARRVFRQVVCAVGYCHEQGVAHRDLKPQNILLDAQDQVKIIDFGLACRFRPGEKLHGVRGTFPYWAPEVCWREEYDGPAADIWSLGVILHLMVTGSLPFKGTTPTNPLQILLARYAFPTHLAMDVQSLIFDMLRFDPRERLTIEQILGHLWLVQEEDFSPGPGSEPLCNHVDPRVLKAMVDIGFDLYETWLSLKNQTFNYEMATYLMLQNQLSQGTGGTFQVNPESGKARGHLSSGSLPPVRRASEPALGAVRSLPSEQIEEDEQSGLKGGRGNSMSAILPFSSVPGTHPSSVPGHDGPVVPPQRPCNVGNPKNRWCQEQTPPEPSSPRSSSRSPPHAGTAAQGKGWKRAAQSLARWCRDICCCCCCCCWRGPRAGHARNQVCPVVRVHRGRAGKIK